MGAFSRGRARSSVLGIRPSASIRYQVSGPRCRVPGTRQGNRAIRRNARLMLRKRAHGVCYAKHCMAMHSMAMQCHRLSLKSLGRRECLSTFTSDEVPGSCPNLSRPGRCPRPRLPLRWERGRPDGRDPIQPLLRQRLHRPGEKPFGLCLRGGQGGGHPSALRPSPVGHLPLSGFLLAIAMQGNAWHGYAWQCIA
jgi:hypothetical protein